MSLKEYYQLLEVKEDATKAELKNAYEKMLLRARHDQTIAIVPINKAYDILTGNEKKELSESEKKKREKAQQRSGKMPFIIMGGIIGIILLVIFVPMMLKTSPDLSITYVGNYQITKSYTQLEEQIEDSSKLKTVEVTTMFIDSNSGSGEADMGGRIALSGMLQSGDADIMIVTKETFDYLLTDDNTIKQLTSDILEQLDIDSNDNRLIYYNEQKVPYGIDVSNIDIINNAVTGDNTMILVISKSTSNYEDVIETIKLLLSN